MKRNALVSYGLVLILLGFCYRQLYFDKLNPFLFLASLILALWHPWDKLLDRYFKEEEPSPLVLRRYYYVSLCLTIVLFVFILSGLKCLGVLRF